MLTISIDCTRLFEHKISTYSSAYRKIAEIVFDLYVTSKCFNKDSESQFSSNLLVAFHAAEPSLMFRYHIIFSLLRHNNSKRVGAV